MASSVSSEREFSSAGLTISKHRNRFEGDIVEVLQFLKCLIRRELVFHTDPSTFIDSDLDKDNDMGGSTLVPDAEKTLMSWNELWLEDDDATKD